MKCIGCGSGSHNFADCPAREDIKNLVIARLENMPDNIKISVG